MAEGYAVALALLAGVVLAVVLWPLLRSEEAGYERGAQRRAELEAAKEAKYREIHDAELDFRMGKLSEADHRATDRELRSQAIEILRQIDQLEERGLLDPGARGR